MRTLRLLRPLGFVGLVVLAGACAVESAAPEHSRRSQGEGDECPNDGLYCGGDHVAGDSSTLYRCSGHVLAVETTCADGCEVNADGTDDACKPPPSECPNDGLYCGGDGVAGDPGTLYRCASHHLTAQETCSAGCTVQPAGVDDRCAPPAPKSECPNDGLYCGGDGVDGDPSTLYRCSAHRLSVQQACASTCHVMPAGANDYCDGASGDGLPCANLQWWNSALTYGPYVSVSGWWDTDLGVSSGTPVQLRHDSQLYKYGVYGWGYMPEFVDSVTGEKFRFLHLRPSDMYATDVGRVYPAGTIVGLSGGDTADTGLGPYSTGSHLCVQSPDSYRSTFPAGRDACY